MDKLATLIQSVNGPPTKEAVQVMIGEADVDGNGMINSEEFINIIARS